MYNINPIHVQIEHVRCQHWYFCIWISYIIICLIFYWRLKICEPIVLTHINICDSKIQVSSVEKLLGVTISNTHCWDAHIDQPIKRCNSYLFLLSRIKVFYLEETEYCFITLTFYLILISIVLSGVTVVLHWKINL